MLFFLAVALRAFFALARSALINMRRPRLVELEQKGVTSARAIQQLTEQSGQLLATAEVGALLGLVFSAGLAVLGFVPPLAAQVKALVGTSLTTGTSDAIAFVIVMLAVALFLFVFGRLVPEALALRYTEPLALALVRPMQWMGIALAPLVRFAVVLSNWLAIPMGGQKRGSAALVTEEELKTMVDAGEEEGLIEEEEKEMILSVLDFGDTIAREVMVPRIDIVALEVNTPFSEALNVVISAGHSRIPVYRGTIDDIIGVLYAKDMLAALRDQKAPSLEQMLRPVYFTPESKRVIELLQELQKQRIHMCIVVDEYGGTAGLITIEDILEEIVGDIQDEYDAEEPEVMPLTGEEGYILNPSMHIEDAAELLKVSFPRGESDSLGGFIYDQLGKVPVVGEKVSHNGWVFEVLAVNDRRILKVKATHGPKQADATEAQEVNGATREQQSITRPLSNTAS
jgi:CBS domain containing-hemolysin-like protein